MRRTIIKLITPVLLAGLLLGGAQAAPSPSQVSAAPLQAFEVAQAESDTPPPPDDGVDLSAIRQMQNAGAKLSIAPQTGGVNFLVLNQAQMNAAMAAGAKTDPTAQAAAFLQTNRGLFGIHDVSKELTLESSVTDTLGVLHLTYTQTYQGLPVYGAMMKVHFNQAGEIAVVNGLFVPAADISTTPAISTEKAGQIALGSLKKTGVQVQKTTLLIYRDGLSQGISGVNHLAYEVEVGDQREQRDLVYLDALTGKVLNTVSGVEQLHRQVFQYNPSTPETPTLIWDEAFAGSDYSGSDPEVRMAIDAAGFTYSIYKKVSGGEFLSYDGNDALMTSLLDYVDAAYCPNASWNGAYVTACDGIVSDDIIAHEWSHAYTDYTHNLIYQWQPGALNEAYSDIYGEIVDLLNGQGTDLPDTPRAASTCTESGARVVAFSVDSPASLAGEYPFGMGDFSPALTAPVTQEIVRVTDGAGTTDDACEAITNSAEVNGKIALIQRGICTFTDKVERAQAAGAAAVIIYNNPSNGDTVRGMTGTPTLPITIPAILIGNTLGQNIVNASSNVTASIQPYAGEDGGELVDTVRWLIGEDSSMGVLRDMWDPTCAGNPGKVSADEYFCTQDGSNDNGGVHSNSGVPNHAFALLVDGGVYNGQTISSIGMNKAAAIYWRVESVYQTPTTDFPGHADALETSCTDLIGAEIYDLESGEVVDDNLRISAADCDQVSKAIEATELRESPSQCGYEPILDPQAPALCSAGYRPMTAFEDNFEGDGAGWTIESEIVEDVTSGYNMPNWVITDRIPAGRSDKAFFAVNSSNYGNCTTNDQSSVRRLISPEISVPQTGAFYLSFDHYLATESGYDGGNLWIQVNDGAWTLVAADDFSFNGYNGTLAVGPGNTNPLASLPAFSGTNAGSLRGSWGQSHVDLSSYTEPGDTIKLAFNLGQDGCTGGEGWYVDDVQAYSCGSAIFIPRVEN